MTLFCYFTDCNDVPPEVEHGVIESEIRKFNKKFVNGSEVKYACNPGSHIFPEDTIICDPTKDWDVENLPQCVPGIMFCLCCIQLFTKF